MSFEEHLLIERFLKNELSEEERIIFIERMETDTHFNKKVVLEQQLHHALDTKRWSFADTHDHSKIKAYEVILKNGEIENIKNVILEAQEIAKKNGYKVKTERQGGNSIRLRWVGSIAALFIITISLFWYFTPKTIDQEKAIENAWNKNIGLDFVLRNNNADAEIEIFVDALKLYENEDFNEVLFMLKEYDSINIRYKDALLLRALSKNGLNRTDHALKTLDTLERYSPDISKWYKGLIYLEAGDLKRAEVYIEVPSQVNKEITFKK